MTSISTIGFTPYGLSVLGLYREEMPQAIKQAERREANVAPLRAVNSEPIQSFSKRQQGEFAQIESKNSVSSPADLRWLVEGQLLSPFGVCALMKRARERGHFLSNVVRHARKQLQSPKVSNTFAYLQALLHRPIDYSFLAMKTRPPSTGMSVPRRNWRRNESEPWQGDLSPGLRATSGRSRSSAW